MFGAERRAWAWTVPLLLFLAVLLVAALAFNLANLDTGGERIPDLPDAGGTPPSSRGIIDPELALNLSLFAMAAILVVGAAYVLLHRRRQVPVPTRRMRRWDFLSSLISVGIFLLLAILWPHIASRFLPSGDSGDGTGGGSGAAPAWPEASGVAAGVFLGGGLLLGLLIVGILLRRSPSLRRPRAMRLPHFPRLQAAAVVEETLAELEVGADVRAAILACFQRFCHLLGRRGIDDQVAMTPRELEDAAVRRLHVPPADAASLTSLFEEARYSPHWLGEEHRGRAIESLRAIRGVLEA